MTQINTPYPATTYLSGYLDKLGLESAQIDFSLELALKLFSKTGLEEMASTFRGKRQRAQLMNWAISVDDVVRFLQGTGPELADRIVSRVWLAEGPRFSILADSDYAHRFASLSQHERAKHLASLWVDDISDFIKREVDPRFELAKYAEKLAASARTYEPLLKALSSKSPTILDQWIDDLTRAAIKKYAPKTLLLTVPFPGNFYGALRIAKMAKKLNPRIKIIMGGGYINTELRELNEARLFDYIDFVTLDDGERPLTCLLEYLDHKRDRSMLKRTFVKQGTKVVWMDGAKEHEVPQSQSGFPTYRGLDLKRYIQLFEMINPMQKLWSDGRWLKLTLAHGCYWKKCSFCDVSLDYISRYEPSPMDLTLDRMEKLILETGESGFHFVDEAAPPAVLRKLAQGILERGLKVRWWGNVRFDKAFTPELCNLLHQSGCIAVSGGLEAASDRLLTLMNKGVSVEQVARVTKAMTNAGIMVHAYLMYGFPSQTLHESVEALDRVRQLIQNGCIHSGFWHQFSATAHSPVGLNPEKFKIEIMEPKKAVFARNDLNFTDPLQVDHGQIGLSLRTALYYYMNGMYLDLPAEYWFKGHFKRVPKSKVPRDYVSRILKEIPNV